ncbi:MAG: hypothetical protein PHV06_04150, partial [bacterium]|nr:hypothetical protein [bacterium]
MKRNKSTLVVFFLFLFFIINFAQDELIYRIELFSVGTDNFILSYKTHFQSDTIIKYGNSENNLNLEYREDTNTDCHYAEIYGLIPNSNYYFRIEDENENHSEVQQVTTFKEPDSSYLFSIGVFTDFHLTHNQSNDEDTGFLYGMPDEFLTGLRSDFIRNTCAFIIGKGDITDHGYQTEFDDFLVFHGSTGFGSSFYPAIGNHDKKDTYYPTAFNTLTSSGVTNYSFDH